MTTRAQVRAFGRTVHRGDHFANDFTEHGTPPMKRILRVEYNVAGLALYACIVIKNPQHPRQVGRVTVLRTRTLLTRYIKVPAP